MSPSWHSYCKQLPSVLSVIERLKNREFSSREQFGKSMFSGADRVSGDTRQPELFKVQQHVGGIGINAKGSGAF